MGNIISIMNMLCHKMIEIDSAINHDTDGIEARSSICEAQVDDITKLLMVPMKR